MYTAVIIDDEPTARDILERHLSKIDTINVVASCKNAAEGFSTLSKQTIDLVFLDINMPEITGLMFAKAIQGNTAIIFTTAYREYALEGFDVQAIDYLLKPISLERLMQGVTKFIASRDGVVKEQKHDFTFFRCDRKMVKVNFDAISYIEGCGDYLKLNLKEEVLITRETMTHVFEKLPQAQFLRTHRSFIIGISNIDSYTNEHITIGRKAIPISRSYREGVLKQLGAIQ
jgi:DNA-binding LytR/AlgR family response regulator